ncbi:PREDICTED: uncharacterized protein LOC104592653 isoform X2 [Nelumbo nucifera]|uniref:Uncharacterized protein n=2 Tax=Nelumbo nucifera TaxID=4432 RepID=A0A822YXX8_NELNU|nr:PREDICTED: uncharacterized protein LOC104592653 isoform X2 [Nelumbo nucifera]DAD36035.1 TPA_asm: hypothetical protein HUJ06_006675 [Nelumbo nucifera]
MSMEKTANVVLDIESLAQSTDKGSGSPKMMRALSRKGSYRMERRSCAEEEELDETSKKLLVKVNSQLESLKQPLVTNKAMAPVTMTLSGSSLIDTSDGRCKRFNHLTAINPRKVEHGDAHTHIFHPGN